MPLIAKPILKRNNMKDLDFLHECWIWIILTIGPLSEDSFGWRVAKDHDLATQIGTQLAGVLYVLDEPSIGLHQSDNIKLINSLKNLRDLRQHDYCCRA
jgi:excinuclease ABC subunit A